MTPPRLLFIGNSHLDAINRAYTALTENGQQTPVEASFIPLYRREFAPRPKPGLFRKDILNRRTVKALRQARDNSVVVSCVGGNAHNILAMVKHPRPFDFVLPEQPDLAIDESAELLPSAAVRLALLEAMQPQLTLLHAVRRHVPGRMMHLESPPPIASTERILTKPGGFRDKLGELGPAPAALRYKMWRLLSSILREECGTLNIEFVPVPAETQDADGMLVERAWHRDPSHGNAWYGNCVLQDLAQRLQTGRAAASIPS